MTAAKKVVDPGTKAQVCTGMKPPGASDQLYAATTELNKARGELIKLKALFEPGTAAYAQCESIDDHLFEVSLKLGE